MNDNRSSNLLNSRPQILTAVVNERMSADERFQNATLRPILKFQNDLFIEVFRDYISKHKKIFHDLSLEKRIDYIENAVYKDMKFRNSIKGMVIGQLTIKEYRVYTENSSALNKRIMNMVKDRLLSSIQLFEKPEVLKAI